MTDPTQRFTNRVDHYVRYRPSYPCDVLDLLETECALTSASVVADVGSGTAILSEQFLENGNRVLGIEPNREMREAAERRLGGQRETEKIFNEHQTGGRVTVEYDTKIYYGRLTLT